jgi:phosphoenolpyruvate synthase/pyruvate phosphate dikinase
MTVLVSYRMDECYEKIAYLDKTIEEKNDKLEKLENSINNSNFILKDIIIILTSEVEEINQIDNFEIEKAIKEKYKSLLGKEVKNLDVDLLDQVIDKRILKFDTGEYKLKVNKLVLTDILKLWVAIEILE